MLTRTELRTPHYSEDFSLVLGGPLFQLFRRSHLAGDSLASVARRIIVISMFCWLPLLALSVFEGAALGGRVAVPFLLDLEVYTRFLLAIPLLIVAEVVVNQRLRSVVRSFLDRGLIPQSAMKRFDAAIDSSFRLRNSTLAEALLLAFVYGAGVLIIWRSYIAIETSTWYATPGAAGPSFSLAGLWLGYVSLPVFQFLLCRWYFRIFIWARFLWQVSRIDLRLVPTHPDRVGGLGFLSGTVYAFVPLLLAHGTLLAGVLGNRIYYVGARLPDFTLEIVALVGFLMCLVLGPLMVFAPQLAAAKRLGKREYGALAERYVREFDAKWLRGGAAPDEPLLGSADIQSLADLGNSFELVRSVRVVPFTRDTVISLAVVAAAPTAPLVLTIIPLEDLIHRLLGVLV